MVLFFGVQDHRRHLTVDTFARVSNYRHFMSLLSLFILEYENVLYWMAFRDAIPLNYLKLPTSVLKSGALGKLNCLWQ